MEYQFFKIGVNLDKLTQELTTFSISGLSYGNDTITVHTTETLTTQQQTDIETIITNHNPQDLNEIYLQIISNAMQFGSNLMNSFAAENIGMGITQMGLTSDVLMLMEKRFVVDLLKPDVSVSVLGTLTTGSLYEAIKVIDLHITASQNGDYDSLNPFLTVTRLQTFKQKIVDYLAG